MLRVILVLCNPVLSHSGVIGVAFLVWRVAKHSTRLKKNKSYKRADEHSCRVNGYLAQWGKLDFIAKYAAITVMTQHRWAEGFLN